MSVVSCEICNKTFYIKPSHQKLGWGKFCSRKCQAESQLNGKFVRCLICNKSIYRSGNQIKRSKSGYHFCSKTCQTLWRNQYFIASRHVNWKYGESAYRNILKRSGRKSICIICKIKDERILTAHHIDKNRKNNRIDNLIWLCLNCHYLVHHDSELNKKTMEALV